MEGSNKTLRSDDTLLFNEIYENTENLPHNEQNLKINDGLDNYGKNKETNEFNVNEDNLRENEEEKNTQSNTFYSVLHDSRMKHSRMKYTDFGEPIKSQHINIDFTPIPGVDDDAFLQQKCMDFWKFINEHPKLQDFESKKIKQRPSKKHKSDQGCSQETEHPAVEMMQRPDMPHNVFNTKFKYTVCEHSVNDYSLGETKVEKRQVKLNKASTLSGPHSYLGLKSRSCIKNKPLTIRPRGLDDVNKLCSEMEHWDLSHPKSMEPPKRVLSKNLE